jgi:hypothetical protein
MPKKDTKISLQKKSDDLYNSDFIIIGDYIESKIKIRIFHKKCNGEYEQIPNLHLSGRGCLLCNKKSRKVKLSHTKEKFIENAINKHKNEYDYTLVKYLNNKTPVSIIHLKCGEIFEQRPDSHLSGQGCTNCNKDIKYTKDQLIDRIRKYDSDYELVSKYTSALKPVKLLHKKCNKISNKLINSFFKGRKCKYCANIVKLSISEIENRMKIVHGDDYEIVNYDYYKNVDSKILFRHKICGKEFSQSIHNNLSGHGCNQCVVTSRGEIRIQKYLQENNIIFQSNYRYSDCRYKYPLPFDLYLPEYNICIEFDGRQHYEPIERFGGQDVLDIQRIKDNIKTKYCESNMIKLIRISYNDFNNISNILDENIKHNLKLIN